MLFWNQKTFDYKQNDILVFKNVTVKNPGLEFDNELQFKACSMILTAPEHPECVKLKRWIKKNLAEIQAMKSPKELKLSFEPGELKSISAIHLKDQDCQIKCSAKVEAIESIRVLNCCPTCNKQVLLIGEAVECENCEKEVSGYRRKIFVNLHLNDGTATHKATMFTETVLKVVSEINKKNIKSMTENEIIQMVSKLLCL